MRAHLTVEQRQLAFAAEGKGLVVAGDRPAGGLLASDGRADWGASESLRHLAVESPGQGSGAVTAVLLDRCVGG
jgi:hypothetical protein